MSFGQHPVLGALGRRVSGMRRLGCMVAVRQHKALPGTASGARRTPYAEAAGLGMAGRGRVRQATGGSGMLADWRPTRDAEPQVRRTERGTPPTAGRFPPILAEPILTAPPIWPMRSWVQARLPSALPPPLTSFIQVSRRTPLCVSQLNCVARQESLAAAP